MDHFAALPVCLKPFLLFFLAANTQGITVLLIVILILLLISFFLAGAEVAFFSLSYKDINMLKTKQDSGWKRIVSLMEAPKILLASLLICNTVVNIAIVVLGNFLIDQTLLLDFWLASFILKVVILTSFIVLFGEVLPKLWASQNHLRFAYNASFLVEIIHSLFKWASVRLVKMSDSVGNFLGNRASSYNSERLDNELSSNEDTTPEEKNILRGILKFSNIIVKQIMRTRLDVSGIDRNMDFHQLINRVEELHYSRLPVYKNNLDEVAGIINTKDLIPHLNEPADFNWHTLMRQPYFVHEQKLIEDLLKEFQTKRIHFAVVVDEFGGTSGIVTLEDIMEEIIGDIKDEFDEEESGYKKIDDFNYLFEGKTMIHDACKLMDLPAETFDKVKGDSDSLAGLMLELAGEIPATNASIPCGDFTFTVLELERTRIKKVKISINTTDSK